MLQHAVQHRNYSAPYGAGPLPCTPCLPTALGSGTAAPHSWGLVWANQYSTTVYCGTRAHITTTDVACQLTDAGAETTITRWLTMRAQRVHIVRIRWAQMASCPSQLMQDSVSNFHPTILQVGPLSRRSKATRETYNEREITKGAAGPTKQVPFWYARNSHHVCIWQYVCDVCMCTGAHAAGRARPLADCGLVAVCHKQKAGAEAGEGHVESCEGRKEWLRFIATQAPKDPRCWRGIPSVMGYIGGEEGSLGHGQGIAFRRGV